MCHRRRTAFAQSLEVPVRRVKLGFAKLGFCPQKLPCHFNIAGHEDAEYSLQAFEGSLVEHRQFGFALRRELRRYDATLNTASC
jgi:hypothetical protein